MSNMRYSIPSSHFDSPHQFVVTMVVMISVLIVAVVLGLLLFRNKRK